MLPVAHRSPRTSGPRAGGRREGSPERWTPLFGFSSLLFEVTLWPSRSQRGLPVRLPGFPVPALPAVLRHVQPSGRAPPQPRCTSQDKQG